MKLTKNTLINIFFLFTIAPAQGNMFSKISSTMQFLNAAILKKNDANQYSELDKFNQKYACPADVQLCMDSLDIFSNNPATTQRSGLGRNENIKMYAINDSSKDKTHYFDKGPGIGRIINAQKLKKYLHEQGLTNRFDIAEESIYQQGSNFTIISKEIELGDQKQKISLDELQDMIKIAKDTGYWDWQIGNNLIRDKQGKLVFVDTEDVGFHTGIGRMGSNFLIHRIIDLCYNYKAKISSEALYWAEKRYNFSLSSMNITKYHAIYGIVQCLLQNEAYNDVTNINIDTVRKQFRKFQRRKMPIQT